MSISHITKTIDIPDQMAENEDDFILRNTENNQTMNDEDSHKIRNIKTYLQGSLKECTTSSVFISKNLSQKHSDSTNNVVEQPQAESTNNNNSFNMDLDDDYRKPEQTSATADTTIYDEQYSDGTQQTNNDRMQHTQTTQTLTTDNAFTDEQQMNALQYFCELLDRLTLGLITLEPALVNFVIPAKIGENYLQCLPISSPSEANIRTQDPLNELANFLQAGMNILPTFRQRCDSDNLNHTIPVGQELNETSERNISAPSENNATHLNQKIQAPASTIPKQPELPTASISLSQLLSEAQDVVHDLQVVELKIVEQPKQYWRKRTINCLRKGWCPGIHGRSDTQRHYIGIKWSKFSNHQNNLFVLAQLLSYDDHPHPSNILVPAGTKVKQTKVLEKRKKKLNTRSSLDDLVIKNTYGFNKKMKSIVYPITDTEYRQCKKNLQAIMFSLYTTSEEVSQTDDDEDDDEVDNSVQEDLQKLSKLRFSLYERTKNGEFRRVSNFIDTELIEQSKGTEPLAIDPAEVTPQSLCKCGNETITVTLNTDSEKSGDNPHEHIYPSTEIVIQSSDIILTHS